MSIFIVLPGHFFENIDNLKKLNVIYLVDEYTDIKLDSPARFKYFKDCAQFYLKYLKSHFKDVRHVKNIAEINLKNVPICAFYDPVNVEIEKKLLQLCKKYKCKPNMLETPGFLNSRAELIKYYKAKKTLRQTSFYKYQREKMNILMKNGRPLGGNLTYDSENRKPLKHDNIINGVNKPFPTNFADSKAQLANFIKNKLHKFGDFQDAITAGPNILLYHAGISPMLNMGLLTPRFVISEILAHFNEKDTANLHNVEGFIRQVIGWREHCRLTYINAYSKMKTANKLKSKLKVPKSWFSEEPKTNILPLKNAISKGWKYGYLHHIERLMIIGSFMLMVGIAPNEAYKWFFHMSCDSFDWNMINNVKIMALYAYPGLYTTKPYVASSNYISKMSDYKHDGIWDKAYDAIYWEFISKYRAMIKKNPRLSMQVKFYDRKTKSEKLAYKKIKNSLIKVGLKV